MRTTLAIESPGVQITRVYRGVLIRLAGDDDPALLRVDDERLMTRHVAGCRHDPHAGHDVGLTFEKLEPSAIELGDRSWKRVVRRRDRFALDLLSVDRHAREPEVVAGMVEVHVAVRDGADLTDRHTGVAQHVVKVRADRLVEFLDLGQAHTKSCVQQDRPAWMADQESSYYDRGA